MYPPAFDVRGLDIRTTEALRRSPSRMCRSFYIVGSTNDRICPVAEHADVVVAELQELLSERAGAGATPAEVQYQKQKLGAHGFGCVDKWTVPCWEWLRKKLEIGYEDSSQDGRGVGHCQNKSPSWRTQG